MLKDRRNKSSLYIQFKNIRVRRYHKDKKNPLFIGSLVSLVKVKNLMHIFNLKCLIIICPFDHRLDVFRWQDRHQAYVYELFQLIDQDHVQVSCLLFQWDQDI